MPRGKLCNRSGLTYNDLLVRVEVTPMNAKQVAEFMQVSIACSQKYIRELRDKGDIVVAHTKKSPKNGNDVPFYRKSTADEKAAILSGTFVEKQVRRISPLGSKDEPMRIPQHDPLFAAFFRHKLPQPSM